MLSFPYIQNAYFCKCTNCTFVNNFLYFYITSYHKVNSLEGQIYDITVHRAYMQNLISFCAVNLIKENQDISDWESEQGTHGYEYDFFKNYFIEAIETDKVLNSWVSDVQ